MDSQNTTLLSEKLLAALEFAAVAHQGQVRKGDKNIPYISHPAAVGMILWKSGYDEDVVAAGILHDIVEDTSYGYDDIKQAFGQRVANLVQEVTEDTSLPFNEKKEGYLNHLATASTGAKAISAADLLSNRYDMLANIKDNFSLWKNTPAKNIERDLRRIDIVKQSISKEFFQELQSITQQVHKYYQNK